MTQLMIEVEFYNFQKQANMLCENDYIIYDNRLVRVKDVSFSGIDGLEIEAQILLSPTVGGWADILVTANRKDVFTLVGVRHKNPLLRG